MVDLSGVGVSIPNTGVNLASVGVTIPPGGVNNILPPLSTTTPPTWVYNRYWPSGSTPDVAVNFANGQAWQKGVSASKPAQLLTCARNAYCYRDNLAGSWLSFPPNTLAYTDKGLRVWEARTNGVRNNVANGATVGGTLPQTWSGSGVNAGTIVYSVIGTGQENGIDYIDVRINGTSASTGGSWSYQIYEDFTQPQLPALTGQIWTHSAFVKLVAGSMNNISAIALAINEGTSGGAFVAGGNQPFTLGSGALGTQRYQYTRTLSGGATVAAI